MSSTDHWAKAVEALREAFKYEGYAASENVATKGIRAALPHLIRAVLEEASRPTGKFPYYWIVGNDVTEVLQDAAHRVASE